MDDQNTKISIKRYRGGYVGEIDMPASDGASPARVVATALGGSKVEAIGKAALLAERIANDPVLAAIMPPQVTAAITAVKGLAGAAKQGSHVLKSFWHSLHGPGKKRLAKALHVEVKRKESNDHRGALAPADDGGQSDEGGE